MVCQLATGKSTSLKTESDKTMFALFKDFADSMDLRNSLQTSAWHLLEQFFACSVGFDVEHNPAALYSLTQSENADALSQLNGGVTGFPCLSMMIFIFSF